MGFVLDRDKGHADGRRGFKLAKNLPFLRRNGQIYHLALSPCRREGERRMEKFRHVDTFMGVYKYKGEDQEKNLLTIFIGLRECHSGKDFCSPLIPKP
jgi:hypothetical protein